MEHILLVISGPSGVGKGTLVKLLLKEDPSLVLSVSCTTRAPRKGEVHGREYFFLTRGEFEKKLGEGGFLEYDEHFGNLYGTPLAFVREQLKKKSVILEIEVEGAAQVKRAVAAMEDKPRLVTVMIVPPDLEALKSRLDRRSSETEEEREGRLARVRYELSRKDEYDYVVVNDDLAAAKKRLRQIIQIEQNRKGDR